MAIIETSSKVPLYEVDGEGPPMGDSLEVRSHWHREDWVVIGVGGHEYTVPAAPLIDAIRRTSR
jgi:hypothetical protein